MRYFISENGSILQFNPTDRSVRVLKSKGWVVLAGADIYHADTAPTPPPFVEKRVENSDEPPPPPPYDENLLSIEESESESAVPPPPPPPDDEDEDEATPTNVKALTAKLFGSQTAQNKKVVKTPVVEEPVPEQVSVSIVDEPNFEPGTLEFSKDRTINVFPISHPIKIDTVSYDLKDVTPTSTLYENLFKFRAEEASKLRALIAARQTPTTLKEREVVNTISNCWTLQQFTSKEIKRLEGKICSKTKVQKLKEALNKLKSYETEWDDGDLYEASYKQLFEDSGLKSALAIHRFSWSPKARHHKDTQAIENAERACPGIANVI